MSAQFRTLRRRWYGAWLLGLLVLPGATHAEQPPIGFEQAPLAIEGANGRFEFVVEMALTSAQRSRGLMFRESLDEDRGMLFDFGRPQEVSMWMHNTLIPLDMLFIREDGQISRIVGEAAPLSDRVILSGGPVRAVLELKGGVADELGIRPGDKVVHPRFGTP